MRVIRLRGLAERADSPDHPLGPGVTVPETVPVALESDTIATIGTARLRRDEQGIWADAAISLEGSGLRFDLMRRAVERGEFRRLWPVFALCIAKTTLVPDDAHPMGVITSGEITRLMLTRHNADPFLPPYEVVPPEDAPVFRWEA